MYLECIPFTNVKVTNPETVNSITDVIASVQYHSYHRS